MKFFCQTTWLLLGAAVTVSTAVAKSNAPPHRPFQAVTSPKPPPDGSTQAAPKLRSGNYGGLNNKLTGVVEAHPLRGIMA